VDIVSGFDIDAEEATSYKGVEIVLEDEKFSPVYDGLKAESMREPPNRLTPASAKLEGPETYCGQLPLPVTEHNVDMLLQPEL